jgi:hypothetical protein
MMGFGEWSERMGFEEWSERWGLRNGVRGWGLRSERMGSDESVKRSVEKKETQKNGEGKGCKKKIRAEQIQNSTMHERDQQKLPAPKRTEAATEKIATRACIKLPVITYLDVTEADRISFTLPLLK